MTVKSTAALQYCDSAHFIHPFTDHASLAQNGARVIVKGEGIYLWDSDGNKLIDGLAGMACVGLGYGHPSIVAAGANALSRLSYAQSFLGTTNPDAVLLAEKLASLAPGRLTHVFFSTSGSEACETAVRMARRYWDLREKPEKKIIIARELAYHGSTVLAASLSGITPMHEAGGDLPISNVRHIGCPYHYVNGDMLDEAAFGIMAADWLEEAILEAGAEHVAAFIAEPFQGAGGVIIPPDTYWPRIQEICQKYDVLLIVDEIISGFGRTGYWFASEHYGITPDIMTAAKALSSAYFPISATLISDVIAKVLIEKGGEFFHGFTNSGHPVGCSIARAVIEVMEKDHIIDHVRALEPIFSAHVAKLALHPLVGNARSLGLAAGFQLVMEKSSKTLWPDELLIGERCQHHAGKRGLMVRAIGDIIALSPPLIITEADLERVFMMLTAALDDTLDGFS